MQSTVSVYMIIGLIVTIFLITLISVLVGAYIAHRIFTVRPGEGLIGGVPKGEVFTIPDGYDSDPEEENKKDELEANVIKRAAQFLNTFGGKKNESSMP